MAAAAAAQTPNAQPAKTAAPQKPTPKNPAAKKPEAKKPAAEKPQSKNPAAKAEQIATELAQRLTPAQQQLYLAYRAAVSAHEQRHRAYWRRVESKRGERKAKRRLGQALAAEDYVATHPPKYQGPELPPEIARIVAEVKPPPRERPLPSVADFLAHARSSSDSCPGAPASGSSSAATQSRPSRSA
jgi:hypothetical protein